MARTANDCILATARLLKNYREGTSTSAGSTTTLIDSNLTYPDGYLVGGTIFFISGTLAGKSAVITAYNAETYTVGFATQTAAAASGIVYGVIPPDIPRGVLISSLNHALLELGPFITVDDTLDVDTDVEEYTLPTGVSNVLRVEEAQTDSEPYQWKRNFFWREINGELIFDPDKAPSNDGYAIRLWYAAPHGAIDADADDVTEQVSMTLLAWTTAVYALLWRLNRVGNDDQIAAEMLNNAKQEALMAKMRTPVRRMNRDPKLTGY